MKYMRLFAVVPLTILFLFALPGCASQPAAGTVTAVSASASLLPDAPATQTKTPAAESTPSISPESTPAPEETPVNTTEAVDETERTVVADGFYYTVLTDEIKTRITGMSFPSDTADCEITYEDLRYIRLKYYDFDGIVHEDGELIVNEQLADEVTQIFYELYNAQYPFTSVRLVDDYGEPGNDNVSMAANNTSGFNYRYVTGTDSLSLHSYGYAIDINPMINPYINGDDISPENGAEYTDRSLLLPGMIDHDDLCYQLFHEHGWEWGGDWEKGYKDYQHFSKDLR